MPRTRKTRAATIAERAWMNSRSVTKAAWDESPGPKDADPSRHRWESWVASWQARLMRFAVQFWREARAEGISDPDDLT